MEQFILFSALLTLTLVAVSKGSLDDPASNKELERMRQRVIRAHDMLLDECPKSQVEKRNILFPTADDLDLELETGLYRQLIDMLVACRKSKVMRQAASTRALPTPKTSLPTTKSMPTSTTTILTTTTSTTTATTFTPTTTATTTFPTTTTSSRTTTTFTPTTTPIPTPAECQSAVNLTEAWRKDHKDSYIKPLAGKLNKDTYTMIQNGRPWFRFTGVAGNQLMNRCVSLGSGGTQVPIWSNATMPTDVGVVTPIIAYGDNNVNPGCDLYPQRMSVIRCSDEPHDYIYRYDDKSGYTYTGFCGMSA